MLFSTWLFLAFCMLLLFNSVNSQIFPISNNSWPVFFLLDFYVDESIDSFISSFHCLYTLFLFVIYLLILQFNVC